MNNIYKISQINLDHIYFSELIQGEDKNLILIKYYDEIKKKKVPLTLQTCSLLYENKINKLSNNDGRTHQLEIPLFSNDNEKVNELKNFLDKLDKKIQQFIIKNAKQLDISNHILYKPIIRDSIEDNEKLQNGVLKFDIINTHKFKTRIFNEERKIVSTDYLDNNICYIKLLLEIPAIWFFKNKCGITIRPCQISVQVDNTLTDTYNFIDSDNDYDDIFVQDTEMPEKNSITFSETSNFNELILNNDKNSSDENINLDNNDENSNDENSSDENINLDNNDENSNDENSNDKNSNDENINLDNNDENINLDDINLDENINLDDINLDNNDTKLLIQEYTSSVDSDISMLESSDISSEETKINNLVNELNL